MKLVYYCLIWPCVGWAKPLSPAESWCEVFPTSYLIDVYRDKSLNLHLTSGKKNLQLMASVYFQPSNSCLLLMYYSVLWIQSEWVPLIHDKAKWKCFKRRWFLLNLENSSAHWSNTLPSTEKGHTNLSCRVTQNKLDLIIWFSIALQQAYILWLSYK